MAFAAHCRSGRTGHALVAGVVGAVTTAHDSGIESLGMNFFGAEVACCVAIVRVTVVCCKLVSLAVDNWSRGSLCFFFLCDITAQFSVACATASSYLIILVLNH